MLLKISEKINTEQWLNYSHNSRQNNAFQLPAFYNFINTVPGYKAIALAIEVSNEIEALCVVTIQKEKGIKGFFSTRAIIYGGPLLNGNLEACDLLLKSISEKLKSVIYIETRNFKDYSNFKSNFEKNGWHYETYLNFHLNCSNEQIVWNNFNSNRKRQIKKAISSGTVLQEAVNESEILEFYAILKNLYLNKIKKPLPSEDFFIAFFKSEVGKILLVKFQNKVIGGIVCPILTNECIYEFYICGLDQEYKDQSPSVMATYAAIEYGFKNNLKYFDFMGAGKSNEDYGVRDFKSKFGGELVEHGRFIKINRPFMYKLGKTVLLLLKKIK